MNLFESKVSPSPVGDWGACKSTNINYAGNSTTGTHHTQILLGCVNISAREDFTLDKFLVQRSPVNASARSAIVKGGTDTSDLRATCGAWARIWATRAMV